MIFINGLSKEFGDVKAVDGVTLHIEKGELFALLGVNGAGKTTLIRMLTGLLEPSEGDAVLGGFSVREKGGRVKAFTGLSPQENAVAPNLTVYENLALMAGVTGSPTAEIRGKCEKMLREFSLEGVRKKRAGKLSGGWQRRLSLAMALIGEPRILFLDEPTLGLDVLARRELWDVIRALKGRVTIVMTTHYMEEAETLADRIGIMKDGRLLMCDTAPAIMERTGESTFENAFVAAVRGEEK